MWTCKKCGNTKIIKKEVEKIEKIGYINSNCSIYNEKIIGSEILEELYHCSKCGAEDNNLENIAYKTEDMYLGYWVKELDKIHKKYFEVINSIEMNIIKKKSAYKNKKDDIYNLLRKSRFALNEVEFKEYRKIIDIALKNCHYKINKYKLQEEILKTHWYIKRNLTISKCYPDDKDILYDMYSNGNYIFDNKEECVNMLERIKNSKNKICFFNKGGFYMTSNDKIEIDYLTFLDINKEIEEHRLELVEFMDRTKGLGIKEKIEIIIKEAKEECLSYGYWMTISYLKKIETEYYIDIITKGRVGKSIFQRKLPTVKSANNNCELEYIWKEWWYFKYDLHKFLIKIKEEKIMGQRLNISIRENNKILTSGYWHWGGFTNSALGILSEMMELIEEFSESNNWRDYYTSTDIAVAFLEYCDCGVLNDRNDGRIRIGKDQDTSEGNIIIDLETKTIKLINIIRKYGNDFNDTIFEFGFLEANDYIEQIINSEDDFKLDGKEYFKIV